MIIEAKPWSWIVPPVAGLLLAACGGSSSSDAFRVRDGTYSASPTAGIVVDNNWAVYFADEATEGVGGSDLNGDGDRVDEVAVAVKIGKRKETLLGVAAFTVAANRGEIYMGVVEAEDGRDWNLMNGLNDFVLLHWSEGMPAPVFVDTLNPTIVNVGHLTVDRRLYYSAEAMPVGDDD